jgi:hypothetical protein
VTTALHRPDTWNKRHERSRNQAGIRSLRVEIELPGPSVDAYMTWRSYGAFSFSVEQEKPMWRAFFLAIGITVTVLGAEFMAVEKAVLKQTNSETGERFTRVVQPPEWVPWTLLSAGAVVILYSFTIPRRVAS